MNTNKNEIKNHLEMLLSACDGEGWTLEELKSLVKSRCKSILSLEKERPRVITKVSGDNKRIEVFVDDSIYLTIADYGNGLYTVGKSTCISENDLSLCQEIHKECAHAFQLARNFEEANK